MIQYLFTCGYVSSLSSDPKITQSASDSSSAFFLGFVVFLLFVKLAGKVGEDEKEAGLKHFGVQSGRFGRERAFSLKKCLKITYFGGKIFGSSDFGGG